MDAIEETIVAEQNVEKARFDLEKAKITGDTERLTAVIDGDLMIVTAEAEATSIANKAAADAAAITVQLASEKAAYKSLFDSISGTLTDFTVAELMAYINTDSITGSQAKEIFVNMDQKV
jgi:regulator of protease activity HflC (stomatin/prohibitin superfamily)